MLKNFVVAISGGAGKIGSSLAKSIIKNHGKVILGDADFYKGKKIAKKLGKNCHYFFGDLTKKDDINTFIYQGTKKFKKIDAAIHCAYPKSKKWGTKFENLDSNHLNQDLIKQLGGAIIFSQGFMQYFSKRKKGNLIHVSSIQGVASPKFEHYENTKMISPIEYSAIKSGIISITSYLAKYYRNKNIRVNCISPGGIKGNQESKFKKKYRKSCTSKGLLDSNDLTGTILFLLSDNSKFINGQNLIVDDGWSL